jgi:hypothetical protein
LKYPTNHTVYISAPKPNKSTKVTLLGYDGIVNWSSPADGGIMIDLSNIDQSKLASQWAWAFKLVNLS